MSDEIQGGGIAGVPKLTAANAAEDKRLAPIPVSPTGLAMLPQILIQVATVVCGLAAVGVAVFTAMLPAPWAITGLGICSAIVALGVPLGISSQGARKVEAAPAAK